MYMINKLKEVYNEWKQNPFTFTESIIWGMIFVFIFSCLIFVLYSNKETIANDKHYKNIKTLVHQQYVDPLVEFNVYYKDGQVSKCKATSVIYGVNDDKIYFLGQFNDTLQILPKIMIEDIREVQTKVKK